MDLSSVIIKLCVPSFYVYFMKVHCGCGVGELNQRGTGDEWEVAGKAASEKREGFAIFLFYR